MGRHTCHEPAQLALPLLLLGIAPGGEFRQLGLVGPLDHRRQVAPRFWNGNARWTHRRVRVQGRGHIGEVWHPLIVCHACRLRLIEAIISRTYLLEGGPPSMGAPLL